MGTHDETRRGRTSVPALSTRARIAATAVLLLAVAGARADAAVNHPFGSHPVAYAAGSILPSHVSQAARDQAVRDFYDQWKATYVEQACGAGRYVVLSRVSGGNLTVSEAHGYGMVLAALMAGHDPDARAIFDGMYAYFKGHPSDITPSLMAWNQNKSCRDVEGADTASDGDLDIAYALLLADKQWGSCGAIDYQGEARNVIAGLESGDLDASGQYVKLGDWAAPDEPSYYDATRTSDFMPDHGRSFLAATGHTVWSDVIERTYAIVQHIQSTYGPATGLLPDFVVDPLGTPDPAPANFLESPNDGAYDYNACRDPWRLGTDFLLNGESRAQAAVQAIESWLEGATGGDPTRIRSGYRLDGSPSPNSDYLSMAFVAPLGVGAMVDAANQSWLDALWDLIVATPLADGGYYENTLKLLAMIVMSGNWWAPEAVTGGCSANVTPLCTNGGTLWGTQITLGRLGGNANDETLQLEGSAFFPQGIPVAAPYTGGAQVLIEDLGNGGSALFELSTAHGTPVPPASAGSCDARRDVWKVTPSTTQYRNGSGALDPPTCTAGSSRGLYLLKYRPRDADVIDVQLKAKKASLGAVVGPLRATLVFGAEQADADAGRCVVGTPVACSGAGSSRRCR